MALDHEAIYKAYPNCGWICDDARDHDGNKIDLDQSLIDAARVELDKLKYQDTRRPLYPSLKDFADAMYWNSKGDSTKLEAYYAACEKVKTDNPKPS
tara:strand:- start:564 stop:854 length:291 start_codon:yes stop_codon:yes gene_type:complete